MSEVTDYSPLVKEVFDTCLGVKAKDRVWIQSWDHTLYLAKAFASECSLRACPHLLSIRYEDLWLRWILKSPKEQLEVVASQEEAALKETDFYIFTMGPRSPVPWDSIPKEKREAVSVWLDTRYDKTLYARKWARIAKTHKVKMLAVEATLATPERAKAQGVNYEEWREVMFRGCMIDHKELARRSKILAKLISGKEKISITTKSGTQLSLALDRRPVGISDGIATEEMAERGRIVFLPAGAIEVSVDEESAEGRIVYDAPVRLGNEIIESLVINLKDGRIQRHTATRGTNVFEGYLEKGGKDAGRFAFFGFGLNPNLRYGYTQDDKVLGGVTLGFGSNLSMGGRNVATDQWWASMTNATVRIDDLTVMNEGKLLV
jgi:leucyl aminopeptidase (aminopeptidase T)